MSDESADEVRDILEAYDVHFWEFTSSTRGFWFVCATIPAEALVAIWSLPFVEGGKVAHGYDAMTVEGGFATPKATLTIDDSAK